MSRLAAPLLLLPRSKTRKSFEWSGSVMRFDKRFCARTAVRAGLLAASVSVFGLSPVHAQTGNTAQQGPVRRMSIDDAVATEFSTRFYRELTGGASLRAAFAAARGMGMGGVKHFFHRGHGKIPIKNLSLVCAS